MDKETKGLRTLALTTDLESLKLVFIEDGRQVRPEDLTMEQKRIICAMYYGATDLMADLAAEVVMGGKKLKGAPSGLS